jgi:hypothetical protein
LKIFLLIKLTLSIVRWIILLHFQAKMGDKEEGDLVVKDMKVEKRILTCILTCNILNSFQIKIEKPLEDSNSNSNLKSKLDALENNVNFLMELVSNINHRKILVTKDYIFHRANIKTIY